MRQNPGKTERGRESVKMFKEVSCKITPFPFNFRRKGGVRGAKQVFTRYKEKKSFAKVRA